MSCVEMDFSHLYGSLVLERMTITMTEGSLAAGATAVEGSSHVVVGFGRRRPVDTQAAGCRGPLMGFS